MICGTYCPMIGTSFNRDRIVDTIILPLLVVREDEDDRPSLRPFVPLRDDRDE